MNDKKIIRKKSISLLLLLVLSFMSSGKIWAQDSVTVTGTIISGDDGSPLPGVNVVEKGTSNGTVTDFDGVYSLEVSGANAVLVVSYVGFKTLEINVDGRETLDVTLGVDSNSLDEVVVVGYGTTKKSDLTGSVVSISGNDLKEQAKSSIAETLTGRLAGVQVASTEGSPDAEVRIRVRGGASLTQSSSPLL